MRHLEIEARKRNNLERITNGKDEKKLQMKCRELEEEITYSFQAAWCSSALFHPYPQWSHQSTASPLAHFSLLVCNPPARGWRSHLLLAFCLPSCSALCLEGLFLRIHIPAMTSMCQSAVVAMESVHIFLVENCSVQGHCRKLLVIYLGKVRNSSFSDLAFGCFWKARSSEYQLPCENSIAWGLRFQKPSV